MFKLRTCILAAWWVCSSFSLRAEGILPIEEGSTWEYEVAAERGRAPAIRTVRIGGPEEFNGNVVAKLETLERGEIVKSELIGVTDRGVLCYSRVWSENKSRRFDPPQTLILAPLKIGAIWELDDTVAGSDMHQEWNVAAEEEIEVPAGKFKAFRLRSEEPWPISIAMDRWFVPGTGFVKDITTTRGPTGRLLSRVTTTLRKFSVVPLAQSPPPPVPTPAPPVAETPARSETPPLPPSPSGADTPAFASQPPALRIKLEVSATRDGPGTNEFRSDIANIFVRWAGENLPVSSSVRIAWVAEDVGDVAPPNFIVDQTETVIASANFGARFTLSRPRDGWAAGKYRIDLFLGDELIDTVKVTIRD